MKISHKTITYEEAKNFMWQNLRWLKIVNLKNGEKTNEPNRKDIIKVLANFRYATPPLIKIIDETKSNLGVTSYPSSSNERFLAYIDIFGMKKHERQEKIKMITEK